MTTLDVIIPTAGRATRMEHLTFYGEKYLLPVYDRPMIWYALKEAASAGASKVILVISPDHECPKWPISKMAEALALSIQFMEQPYAKRGLGHAILAARPALGSRDVFGIILPDNLVFPRPQNSDLDANPLAVLWDLYQHNPKVDHSPLGAVQPVGQQNASRFGIATTYRVGMPTQHLPEISKVLRLEEKPANPDPLENFALTGRYIVSKDIFDALWISDGLVDRSSVLQLTTALNRLAKSNERVPGVWAVEHPGIWIACDTPDELYSASGLARRHVRR